MVKNKEASEEEIKEVKEFLNGDDDVVEVSSKKENEDEAIESLEKNEQEPELTQETDQPEKLAIKKQHGFKRFVSTKKGKAIIIVGVLVLIVVTLLAIPVTRYAILGNVVKRSVGVMVMDASTMKPVSQAEVVIGDKNVKTDKKGEATLNNVPVGEYTLKITKGYYKTQETAVTVPVLGELKQQHASLAATGRQVSFSVSDRVTGAVLAGATLKVKDTSAVTDSKGIATIVLPVDKKTLQGTVSLTGYNESAAEVKITDNSEANKVALTPSGEIYYLSKQTGKINVMKANLDGRNPKVVVEATGNENDQQTVLLAARDWDYMALLAKRDPKKEGQLHLVDAKTGSLKLIDEGNASFSLIGWSGHKFIYSVYRNNSNVWEEKVQRLKSYDADTGKITILDENAASGTDYYDAQYESLGNVYILESKIVYYKTAYRGGNAAPDTARSAIMSVNPDGSQKQRLKEFGPSGGVNIQAKLYQPQEVYFRVLNRNSPQEPTYYEYENNTLKSISNSDDKFIDTFYPTYLISPNGQKTFWYEPRDGKNTLLTGDKDGKNTTIIANQSEYKTYGWYSDKYLLVSKDDSELYITSADKPLEQPLKITNYHKPNLTYPGYGYGYGGL